MKIKKFVSIMKQRLKMMKLINKKKKKTKIKKKIQ